MSQRYNIEKIRSVYNFFYKKRAINDFVFDCSLEIFLRNIFYN